MSFHEIVLSVTKPETEWVRGRPLQKIGGTYTHSAVQMVVAMALRRWAEGGGHGRVAPSWRFRVAPPNEMVRPLAPDVAFLSYDALSACAPPQAVQVPLGTPTVVVEVLSEDDLAEDITDKLVTYRSAGCSAFIVIDPGEETVTIHDPCGEHVLGRGEMLRHAALPEFNLAVGQLFDDANRLGG
jgi:Uma2 family endonuclease